MTIRWGFLGTGRVTQRMVEALLATPGARLAAIASRDRRRAEAWLREQVRLDPQEVRIHEGYAAIIDDDSLDWLYVALPPALHATWVERGLQAGRHILCEKPLGVNHPQAVDLAESARQCRRLLLDATAYPHHPRSIAARNIIRSGELGALRRVTMACTSSDIFHRANDHRTDPALGGGCLLDLGWYCVHATLWLTGLRCQAVQAIGSRRHQVWYQVQVMAELSDGAIAHWDCGFDTAGRKWIEVAGEQGSWICDDFPRPWDRSKPRFWVHGKAGKVRGEVHGEEVFQEAELLRGCVLASVQESASNEAGSMEPESTVLFPAPRLSLALETHRILDAIELSAVSGQRVVLGLDS